MNIACILAGGLGMRMPQKGLPKQYRMLGDKPVLLWSMRAFDEGGIDLICIVAARCYHKMIREDAKKYEIKAPLVFAIPGKERFDSAYAALLSLSHLCKPDDILLFHDAARPLVSKRIIKDNIRLAKTWAGVYTAIPSSDSVFVSEDGKLLKNLLQRSTLWQGQTPQSFRYEIIQKAHEHFRSMQNPPPVTDDCSLIHLLGEEIAICPGEKSNMKITTAEDLLFLQALVSEQTLK